ncbi:MAG TPA: hypothetical protein VFG30_30820 [Polyangiales bacterium]|jgi:hypothetical protein|nr:hypothetical protein [Polyangiales bacterium]
MQATSLLAATAAVLTLGLIGCSTPAVGAPCLPEQVPGDGFDQSEAYIETSSVQCETRVCMVYQLAGAPPGTAGCKPQGECRTCTGNDPKCVAIPCCAAQEDIEKRVYCTCRCDVDVGKFAECSCPSGFTCAQVLEQGNAGVRGKYCVRDGTVNLD